MQVDGQRHGASAGGAGDQGMPAVQQAELQLVQLVGQGVAQGQANALVAGQVAAALHEGGQGASGGAGPEQELGKQGSADDAVVGQRQGADQQLHGLGADEGRGESKMTAAHGYSLAMEWLTQTSVGK